MVKKLYIKEEFNDDDIVKIVGERNYKGLHTFILQSPIFNDFNNALKFERMSDYEVESTGHGDRIAVYAEKEELPTISKFVDIFNRTYFRQYLP